MEASCAAVTYAEQLVGRGHGLPLWHPEPQSGPFGETEIGDVGFVSEGHFVRLFNALRTADDPINGSRVPSGFVPLVPNERMLKDDLRAVEPGPICTTSTTWRQIAVDADASIGLSGIGASYSFRCTNDQGAVAILGDYGHQRWYLSSRQFRDYIVKHHASWCAFADEEGHLVTPDAMILVSGWLKTSEWTIATFSSSGRSHSLDLNASAGPYGSAVIQASGGEERYMSIEQRSSPRKVGMGTEVVERPPRDQCLFLRYYKLKTRALGRPRVVLQADARDVQGPWQDASQSPRLSSTTSVPRHPQPGHRSLLSPFLSCFARFAQYRAAFVRRRPGSSVASSIMPGSASSSKSVLSFVEELPIFSLLAGSQDPLNDVLDYILLDPAVTCAVVCHDDFYAISQSHESWHESMPQYLADKKPAVDVDGHVGYLKHNRGGSKFDSKPDSGSILDVIRIYRAELFHDLNGAALV